MKLALRNHKVWKDVFDQSVSFYFLANYLITVHLLVFCLVVF